MVNVMMMHNDILMDRRCMNGRNIGRRLSRRRPSFALSKDHLILCLFRGFVSLVISHDEFLIVFNYPATVSISLFASNENFFIFFII